jgi:hypothetical protein
MGGKYLQIIYLVKDLYPEYVKNDYNSIIKIQLRNKQASEEIFLQRYANGKWPINTRNSV